MHADVGTVYEIVATGGNNCAKRRLTHELAKVQRFVGVREDLGVAVAVFVAKRN